MKRIIPLSILILLSFISVVAQQNVGSAAAGNWIEVAPPGSGFSVLMPSKPAEKVDPVANRPGIENHLLTLETKSAGYVVSFVQFPDEITDAARIKDLLDGGRDGGLSSTGGRLKSEKEIKLNGFFGREWLVDLPGGISTIARAYWVKRSLYQIVFISESPVANESAEAAAARQELAARFLNSFTLTEK